MSKRLAGGLADAFLGTPAEGSTADRRRRSTSGGRRPRWLLKIIPRVDDVALGLGHLLAVLVDDVAQAHHIAVGRLSNTRVFTASSE